MNVVWHRIRACTLLNFLSLKDWMGRVKPGSGIRLSSGFKPDEHWGRPTQYGDSCHLPLRCQESVTPSAPMFPPARNTTPPPPSAPSLTVPPDRECRIPQSRSAGPLASPANGT